MAMNSRLLVSILVSMVIIPMVVSTPALLQDEDEEVNLLLRALIDVINVKEKDGIAWPPPPAPVPYQGCGKPNINELIARVMGGQESKEGMWPWQVLIYTMVNRAILKEIQCGGSLIHEQWVLTAAHCIEDNERSIRVTDGNFVTMYFGANSRNALQKNHEKRKASKVFIHPDRTGFNMGSNDIALLKLEKPLVLGKYVQLVCLPPPYGIPAGTSCVTSGWGQTVYNKGSSIKLLHVDQTLIGNSECRSKVSDVRQDNICSVASGKPGSACKGDDGGPLVCLQGNRYQLAGVTVRGGDCGKQRIASSTVYASVSYYLPWINSVIKDN